MPIKTVHAPLITPGDLDVVYYEVRPMRMSHFVRRHAVAYHLVTKGTIRVLMATGRRYAYSLGRITLTWGAIPHLAEYSGDRTHVWSVTFPVGLLLRWDLPKPFIAAALRGEALEEPNADETAHDAAMFMRWRNDVQRGDAISRQLLAAELQARTRRLARDWVEKRRSSKRKSTTAAAAGDRVERMLQLIANSGAEVGRPILRVSDVAASVGLHADTASRLFARSVGMGLGEFLTQHRMAVAQSLLASTDAKIADIAASAGFGSVSQFHAVFRRHTKLTPDRYRKAARTET